MATDFEEEQEEVEEGAPPWMATFADLATLLLTFFVLLLSFANMDVQDFRVALGSVKEALGVQFEHPGDHLGLTTSIVEMSKRESTSKMVLFEDMVIDRIKEIAEAKGLRGGVEAMESDRGVTVRIKEGLLFKAGGAELNTSSDVALEVILEASKQIDYPIWIEGHTDSSPIRTKRYPSNWELSAARAVSALRFLVKKGVSRSRLRIAGYGDVNPIASNTTVLGRQKNRRVEFVFVRPSAKKVSSSSASASEIEKETKRKSDRTKR